MLCSRLIRTLDCHSAHIDPSYFEYGWILTGYSARLIDRVMVMTASLPVGPLLRVCIVIRPPISGVAVDSLHSLPEAISALVSAILVAGPSAPGPSGRPLSCLKGRGCRKMDARRGGS
jgi:hypothetical protein